MPHEDRNALAAEIQEDVSREEIALAFRAAMVGHFRAHVPGTNVNEETLLASDYLSHFHDLVTLFEALSTEPGGMSEALISWRPMGYEQHFAQSDFREKDLAIAAYRRAPAQIRADFDDAVSRLQGEALRLVATVGNARGSRKQLAKTCVEAADRLRILVGEAEAIANGEMPAERGETPDQQEMARIAV